MLLELLGECMVHACRSLCIPAGTTQPLVHGPSHTPCAHLGRHPQPPSTSTRNPLDPSYSTPLTVTPTSLPAVRLHHICGPRGGGCGAAGGGWLPLPGAQPQRAGHSRIPPRHRRAPELRRRQHQPVPHFPPFGGSSSPRPASLLDAVPHSVGIRSIPAAVSAGWSSSWCEPASGSVGRRGGGLGGCLAGWVAIPSGP